MNRFSSSVSLFELRNSSLYDRQMLVPSGVDNTVFVLSPRCLEESSKARRVSQFALVHTSSRGRSPIKSHALQKGIVLADKKGFNFKDHLESQ